TPVCNSFTKEIRRAETGTPLEHPIPDAWRVGGQGGFGLMLLPFRRLALLRPMVHHYPCPA
ncbi:MAG: hypothetical protein ACPIOQ_31470, partial [Promethearchaeia archaeon]